ncbi:MAG: class I SAM-dependent methyltransferase [Actinomycetota bacterium]|nr:class I SAM-dependent methyltransferase [Actinomycetota bacterium]
MGEAFDRYKDSYREDVQRSIGFVGQSHDFFTASKARHLLDLVRRNLGATTDLRVLDVGCGVGVTDALISSSFRSVHGVDVAAGVVDRAAAANPAVDYRTYDGENLPFPDASMDVTFAICVLHHVAPPARVSFVDEMKRVTRAGGLVLIFEHNPVNPLTRLAVARCEFDEDVVLLSKRDVKRLLVASDMAVVEERYILFLPWMIDLSQKLDRLLHWLPLGAQHVTVARPTAP